jgi:hypothetical protein
MTRIGYVSQFGNVSKQVPMTKTEGTTGMTGAWMQYSRTCGVCGSPQGLN